MITILKLKSAEVPGNHTVITGKLIADHCEILYIIFGYRQILTWIVGRKFCYIRSQWQYQSHGMKFQISLLLSSGDCNWNYWERISAVNQPTNAKFFELKMLGVSPSGEFKRKTSECLRNGGVMEWRKWWKLAQIHPNYNFYRERNPILPFKTEHNFCTPFESRSIFRPTTVIV